MRKLISLLFMFALTAGAATRIETWITITNLPVGNTNSLTWNSASNVVWTNLASTAYRIQTTNNIQNSRTNLKAQMDAFKFRPWHLVNYGTNTNDVVLIVGTNEPVTIAIGGLWATVRYVTNTTYISDFVLMPPNPSQSNSFLTWQMSALATNWFRSTSSIGNVAFTNITATNVVVSGFSSPGSGGNSLALGANASGSGLSSTTIGNQATNDSSYGMAIGDSAKLYTSQWTVEMGKSVWASNSQHSVLIGATAVASNALGAVAIGKSAIVLAQDSIAIGRLATIGVDHSNSVALGASASTTTNFQVRLGSSTSTVSIPGQLDLQQTGTLSTVFATNLFASNAVVVNGKFTNVGGVFTASKASTWIIDGLTATNLSVPGSGAQSEHIGASSIASGTSSLALGQGSEATNTYSTAVGAEANAYEVGATAIGNAAVSQGYGSTAIGASAFAGLWGSSALGALASSGYSNATAIGYASSTTTTNQVRLGTANDSVSIPGLLLGAASSNSVLHGSNIFTGSFRTVVTNATGMANGDVLLDFAPLKTLVELSGNTAAINICGIKNGEGGRHLWLVKTNVYNVVVRNLSGAAGTASGERIYTGTGADVTLTNTPNVIHLIYSSGMSAWVLDKPL